MRRFWLLLLIVLSVSMVSVGQAHSQVPMGKDSTAVFKPTQLIVPATLIGVGIIGLESDWLSEISEELQENIDHKLTFDDFSQYAPAAAVYALNLCGVRGRHDAIDQTILFGTAGVLMGITVNTLKHTTRVERPDGSARNSFPSGHTAMALEAV